MEKKRKLLFEGLQFRVLVVSPKVRGTILGVPIIIRIIICLGLHWSPLISGNYRIGMLQSYGHVCTVWSLVPRTKTRARYQPCS